MIELIKKRKLSSAQIIILGFTSVILVGTLLLMLPFASREAGSASFMEALFTATSATCVTGLVVQDTATYWTLFGQIVILIMIQIGGMGVLTMAALIAVVSGKKIGLMQRSAMQEALSAHNVGGIVKLTNFIVAITLCIEGLGTISLWPVFAKEFGMLKGFWYALFHSISAFCNAGFDLMGIKEQFSSLTYFHAHPVVNFTVMFLLITGGIGFMTWEDIRTQKWHIRKYRMQTKVIFLATAVLIIIPTIVYYMELKQLSGWERFIGALFQAVTPRTAGFNTLDLNRLSEPGRLLMIILMLIGGAPGSTAGGIKVTTAIMLVASTVSVFRRKEDTECFKRRVDADVIRNATAILILYISMFSTVACIISWVEKLPLMDCLFETASAIGTVGLTLGITPDLGGVSRLLLIILMFMGRVGGLTLVFAASFGMKAGKAKLPREKITVG